MGFTKANVTEGADLSPYIQLENLDPKWLKAIGYDGAAKQVAAEREKKEKTETSGAVRGS